jgi:hypothetical protein
VSFNEKYPDSLRTMEQRLVYRVRPSLIWQLKRYDTMELIVGVVNDGVAGVPDIRMRGSSVRRRSFWPKGMDGQQIKLRAELAVKGVKRPVRWACHNPTNPDGSLTIRLKNGGDSNWRKGV